MFEIPKNRTFVYQRDFKKMHLAKSRKQGDNVMR